MVSRKSKRPLHVLSAAALLAASAAAVAQVSTDFEAPTYAGSAAGTPLTHGFGMGGQDGWYNPVDGSNETHIFTYVGNPYNIPQNPAGGAQFQAGVHAGLLAFARAQRGVDFGAGGVWVAQWDVLANYTGTAANAENNIGSFSLQPSANSRYFQQILQWPAATTPTPVTTFQINYGIFNTAPYNQASPAFVSPGPQWQNLTVNNWYRQTTTWDFDTARILEVSIQDLTAGTAAVVVDVSSMGWYLFGGPSSTMPLPTDFRLFTGGGAGSSPGGNLTAWDNIIIGPASQPCYADCDGNEVLNVDDFICFINAFAVQDPYADCDGNQLLNIDDFICFINAFAQGCP
jgi:hypothetical protein